MYVYMCVLTGDGQLYFLLFFKLKYNCHIISYSFQVLIQVILYFYSFQNDPTDKSSCHLSPDKVITMLYFTFHWLVELGHMSILSVCDGEARIYSWARCHAELNLFLLAESEMVVTRGWWIEELGNGGQIVETCS